MFTSALNIRHFDAQKYHAHWVLRSPNLMLNFFIFSSKIVLNFNLSSINYKCITVTQAQFVVKIFKINFWQKATICPGAVEFKVNASRGSVRSNYCGNSAGKGDVDLVFFKKIAHIAMFVKKSDLQKVLQFCFVKA